MGDYKELIDRLRKTAVLPGSLQVQAADALEALQARLTRLEEVAKAHCESWARSPDEDVPTPEETIDILAALLEEGSK